MSLGDFRPTEFSSTRRLCSTVFSNWAFTNYEFNLTHRSTQDHQTLFTSRQSGVSSPHNCSRVDHPGCLGQRCACVRACSSAVPHFCLPVVNADFGVSPEFLPNNGVYVPDSVRLGHHIQVVQVCEQLLSWQQSLRDFPQRSVLPEAEEHGHESVSLLSTLSGCGGRHQPHLPRGTWKGLRRTTLQRAEVAHLPSLPIRPDSVK